jgi:hypothetical protein
MGPIAALQGNLRDQSPVASQILDVPPARSCIFLATWDNALLPPLGSFSALVHPSCHFGGFVKFTLSGLVAVILVPLVSAQIQPFAYGHFFKIPANTVIRVRTMDEVSSETARVGDIVQMEVLADVLVNGYVVVRQAATAVGQISRVKEARSMGRRGNVGSLSAT